VTVVDACAAYLVMLGWVAGVVLVVLVGKTLLDYFGERVYGRMDKD
jgi:hypothetical protein